MPDRNGSYAGIQNRLQLFGHAPAVVIKINIVAVLPSHFTGARVARRRIKAALFTYLVVSQERKFLRSDNAFVAI